MTGGVRTTAFVTEAGGFLGLALVKVLTEAGHQVTGLTGSTDGARQVRAAGGTAVVGDLSTPGQWHDEAAADWVFHLPANSFERSRLTRARTVAIARERVVTDGGLLDVVAAGPTRRIVYVSDAACYGPTANRPITEDAPLGTSAWGQCFRPALARVDDYLGAGLPIVTALPGWIYGRGGWLASHVIAPIMSGRRVWQFGDPGPLVSPIHVRDCARALLHVAIQGEAGGRYFLVNSEPVRTSDFARSFARQAGRPLRVWRVPSVAAPLVAGPVMSEQLQSNGVFTNIRLRGIGFRFEYSTLEQGLQEVIGVIHE